MLSLRFEDDDLHCNPAGKEPPVSAWLSSPLAVRPMRRSSSARATSRPCTSSANATPTQGRLDAFVSKLSQCITTPSSLNHQNRALRPA